MTTKENNDMQSRRERTTDFRRALRRALGHRGWTQAELAKSVGVTQPTIGNWLRGTYVPDTDNVFAMERALSLVPGQLSVHLGYVPVAPGSILGDLASALLQSDEGRSLLGPREALDRVA